MPDVAWVAAGMGLSYLGMAGYVVVLRIRTRRLLAAKGDA